MRLQGSRMRRTWCSSKASPCAHFMCCHARCGARRFLRPGLRASQTVSPDARLANNQLAQPHAQRLRKQRGRIFTFQIIYRMLR